MAIAPDIVPPANASFSASTSAIAACTSVAMISPVGLKASLVPAIAAELLISSLVIVPSVISPVSIASVPRLTVPEAVSADVLILVKPLIVPPEIFTLLASWLAIVPMSASVRTVSSAPLISGNLIIPPPELWFGMIKSRSFVLSKVMSLVINNPPLLFIWTSPVPPIVKSAVVGAVVITVLPSCVVPVTVKSVISRSLAVMLPPVAVRSISFAAVIAMSYPEISIIPSPIPALAAEIDNV